uniref:Nuclear pore complex protein NUP1-like n=1 Tax=Kalanchoe fedtschenkoi TaxID=63787 RepID=A0A7N0U583_KALFE
MSTAAEAEAEAAKTVNGGSSYDGRGAGGKFRRQPFRKSQATPYNRPPIAVRNPSNRNGWLSKIVDPASKIITASAHRLFSSVFRKRLLPPPQQTSPPPAAARQPASVAEVDRPIDSNLGVEIQEKVGDQTGAESNAKDHVYLDNNNNNQGISDLEKLLKQKTFTKVEIDRLTALLNSRTIEAPTEDDKKASDARASKMVCADGNLKEPICAPVPDNRIQMKRYVGASSPSIINTKILEEDTATPAELAKVYMGYRPSKVSPSMVGSRGQPFGNDLPMTNSMMFPSHSPSMRTATKSFTRLVTSEKAYMTPRSKGRSAIYCMARTPYSRVQKSSDIRTDNNYSFQSSQLALDPNKLSSSRQMGLKRRSSALDNEIGSVGPVRRIRQKPGLLSTQTLTGTASGSFPVKESGAVLNHFSQDVGNRTPGANFMSVPSQSSEVAQKILQQLDKLAPSPKEKSSEWKLKQPPGKSPFTLTPDMLTGQALRSLEKIDSSKFLESPLWNNKLSDSVQRATTNVDYTILNSKNELEENGSKKLTSMSNINSEIVTHSSDRPLAKNKRAFQIIAHEDCLDLDDNDRTNSTVFARVQDEETRVNSSPSLDNKPQMTNVVAANENALSNEQETHVSSHLDNKSDRDQAASNGLTIPEIKNEVYYSALSPSVTIQPTATENVSSTLFAKVSSGDQSTTTSHFDLGGKVVAKFTPVANDSQAIQISVPASNSSILSDTPIAKPYDSKGAQETSDREGKPSAATFNGVSTSTLFSSVSYDKNGFSNGSLSVQPAVASSLTTLSGFKNVNGEGAYNPNSSVSPASAISVLDASNTTNGISGTGTSMSPANAVSSEAPTVGTAAASVSPNTFLQYSTSGFSSAPTSGLFGTATFASPSAMSSCPAPYANVFTSSATFGLNSTPSSKEASGVSSTSGSVNTMFGSNWQYNSSLIFGSTTSSSTTSLDVFQFGSSAASSASNSSSSMPGSLIRSTGASAGPTFSFNAASATTSSSPFFSSQPAFGSSNPVFAIASAALPANNGCNSNHQMSMEDTMAEDTVQASAPSTPAFGQPESMPGSFVLSSAPSVNPPGTGPFQFGSQPSPASVVNQSPFQANGSFNTGGSFSLGTGGGDKAGRKIIKVRKGPKRR